MDRVRGVRIPKPRDVPLRTSGVGPRSRRCDQTRISRSSCTCCRRRVGRVDVSTHGGRGVAAGRSHPAHPAQLLAGRLPDDGETRFLWGRALAHGDLLIDGTQLVSPRSVRSRWRRSPERSASRRRGRFVAATPLPCSPRSSCPGNRDYVDLVYRPVPRGYAFLLRTCCREPRTRREPGTAGGRLPSSYSRYRGRLGRRYEVDRIMYAAVAALVLASTSCGGAAPAASWRAWEFDSARSCCRSLVGSFWYHPHGVEYDNRCIPSDSSSRASPPSTGCFSRTCGASQPDPASFRPPCDRSRRGRSSPGLHLRPTADGFGATWLFSSCPHW